MKLFTKDIEKRLIANARRQEEVCGHDPYPVVKIFDPCGAATWLLTEYDPETGLAFGLCDLGMGTPEIGYVDRTELELTRGATGLHLERDLYFRPGKSLSAYLEEARDAGRIAA